MEAHAFLPPSSAHRWVHCPLSASLEALYPETEPSEASREGTAAHWVIEQMLRGTPAAVDTLTPAGLAVTQEMVDAAVLVLEVVLEDTAGVVPLSLEERVDIPRVHPTQNWGTPDIVARRPGRLTIYDFKFGHGVVEVKQNWQMIDYAAGLIGEGDESIEVEFVIIQPRAFHRDGTVRRWLTTGLLLRGYFNQLASAAARATETNPRGLTDPDCCRECKGRHACETLQRAAYVGGDRAGAYLPLELTPLALGRELKALKRAQALLDARVSGLEAQVVASIKSGKLIPFWTLESSPGRLAWTKPAGEVLALGHLLGLDLKKPEDVITPTQAKAAAKAAKVPETIFDSFAARPAGSVKLTYDDGAKVSSIFSN